MTNKCIIFCSKLIIYWKNKNSRWLYSRCKRIRIFAFVKWKRMIFSNLVVIITCVFIKKQRIGCCSAAYFINNILLSTIIWLTVKYISGNTNNNNNWFRYNYVYVRTRTYRKYVQRRDVFVTGPSRCLVRIYRVHDRSEESFSGRTTADRSW